MKLKPGIVALFVTTSLPLAACGLRLGDGAENGRILLWHTWQGAGAQLLEELILEYNELHPEVSIIAVPVSPHSIVARFQDRSASGLGPDPLDEAAFFVGGPWILPQLQEAPGTAGQRQ